MSRNEQIKEQIGWLKVVFGILSAVLISLIGFLATKYKTIDTEIEIMTTVLIIIVSSLIVVVNKIAFNKISELKDL